MVLALGNIQAHDQILSGSANLALELTELIDFVTLGLVHGNLLLALRVVGWQCPYAIRRLLLFLRDNFFPLCYTSKDLLLFLKYITRVKS